MDFEAILLEYLHATSGLLLNGNDVTVRRYIQPSSPRHPQAGAPFFSGGSVCWAVHHDIPAEPEIIALEDLLAWLYQRATP